jgi:hypothetical protein
MTKPKLSITQPDGSRKYVHPLTGETVPSVTTVMRYLPQQHWKVDWALRMAAQHATANWLRLSKEPHSVRLQEMMAAHETYAQERADVGDIVHDLVEAWSIGTPYPDPPKNVNGYINQFIDFLTTERPEFIENEVTLWSRTYGYAGTADFIVKIGGRTLLADLKTGKNLHDEIGLQLSALSEANFILRVDGTEEAIPVIDGLAGLHLRPRSWKLVEISYARECFECFLHAKGVMEWMEEIAPNILPTRGWTRTR